MNIRHLTARDFRTSAWSGGTTTELFLFPEDGSYAQRNFRVRISSATVELEESDFTPLPSVERYITPLEGGFTLTHPGASPVVLTALAAPYRFSGQISTHCVGKATDFNLMLKDCDGRMELHREIAPLRPGFNGLYAIADGIFSLQGQQFVMKKGELLIIQTPAPAMVQLTGCPALLCWADI